MGSLIVPILFVTLVIFAFIGIRHSKGAADSKTSVETSDGKYKVWTNVSKISGDRMLKTILGSFIALAALWLFDLVIFIITLTKNK